jgi:hypothetical protein
MAQVWTPADRIFDFFRTFVTFEEEDFSPGLKVFPTALLIWD